MDITPSSPLNGSCAVLAHDPLVTIHDDFLTATECDALIACSTVWRRSGVSLESRLADNTSVGRSSSTAVDSPELESALAPLRQRLALLFGVADGQFEASTLLHYDVGGAYRWHYDGYDQTTTKGKRYMARRGQRLATAIVYLNTVESGGETAFFFHRKAIAPRAGRLLTFRNVVGCEGPHCHVLLSFGTASVGRRLSSSLDITNLNVRVLLLDETRFSEHPNSNAKV